MKEGTLYSINVSGGGVPKGPRRSAAIRAGGVEGDRQSDLRYHGGPARAVSLYSQDLIRALQAQGHPISPGSLGENLTLAGVDWALMRPGARLEVGGVLLEITKFYSRVLREGTVSVGDRVHWAAAGGDEGAT